MPPNSPPAPRSPITAEDHLVFVAGQRRFSRMLIPGNGVSPAPPVVLIFLHEGLGCTAMWHDFVEPVTRDGIRAALRGHEANRMETELARCHGAKARDVFFDWTDIWLADAFQDRNIEAHLTGIGCPVLALQGEHDPYGTPQQVAAVLKGVGRRSSACMIPDCGHTPHREARPSPCAQCGVSCKHTANRSAPTAGQIRVDLELP